MSEQSRREREDAAVGAIAARFGSDHAIGDVAALRRLRDGTSHSPSFWRIAVAELEPRELARDAEQLGRWAVLIQAMAHLAGQHRPSAHLGAELAEADFSEMRFERLLRASGEALGAEVRRAAQFLRSKGADVDQRALAQLIFSDARPDRDQVRQGIASGYYRRAFKQETTT